MLPLAGLKKKFSQVMWSRGQRIQNLKHVLKYEISQDQDLVTGVVQSEVSNAIYDVFIDIDENQIFTSCSCPVKHFCKHAAALTLELMKKNGEHFSTSNQELESWLKSMKPAVENKVSPQSSDILVYILEASEFNKHRGVSVSVYRTRVLKSGELSKSLRHVHINEFELKQAALSQHERHLLADLIVKKQSLGYHEDYSLIERIVQTNRCYWKEITLFPLSLGRHIDAKFSWLKKQNGMFQLSVDTEIQSAEVLYTEPPCYINHTDNTIGIINFNVESDKALALIKMPLVNTQQLGWLLPQLKSYLADDFNQIGLPDASLDDAVFEPVAHLRLHSPHYYPQNAIAMLTFYYNEVEVSPRETRSNVKTNAKVIARNLWHENQIVEKLKSMGFSVMPNYEFNDYGSNEFRLSLHPADWPNMLHTGIPELIEQGWKITVDKDFYYSVAQASSFDAEIEEHTNGFFTLSIDVDINGKKQPLLPILQGAISQIPRDALLNKSSEYPEDIFIDMGKGQFLSLPFEKIKPLINQFVELFLPTSINKAGKIPISKLLGHHALEILDNNEIATRGAANLREFSAKLRGFDGIKAVKCPPEINATLRDYQHEGLNWLQFLREFEIAGILADDMGLGKTIQAIANLTIEKIEGRLTSPALIVAPTSVIFNWHNEIQKFSPNLKHIVVHGDKRKDQLDSLDDYEIIITSYPLIVRDLQYYNDRHFHYLILDEAQYIKNPKTKLYESLMHINSTHRLCMTGTPLENHLGELWAQFNFLLPGLLGTKTQFTKLFRTPIEKQKNVERQQVLNKRIQPFVLRRTKDKIAKELPAKTEIIQTIRLEGSQASLYESVRLTMDSKLRSIIESKGLTRSHIEILDAMLKLRQVCCHPQLLAIPSAQKVKESAKLNYLMEIIPELVSEGRRILLFSQFTSMLALIETEFRKEGIEYCKLTGSTKHRQKVIDTFKSGDVPVFLISLKAGGTGLNLTEADVVIHYDPWWNPAVENQATDRAHRIGQDKPVFVYKLVVEGSIEQKIVELQAHKSALADAVLSDKLSDKSVGLDVNTLQSLFQPLNEYTEIE